MIVIESSPRYDFSFCLHALLHCCPGYIFLMVLFGSLVMPNKSEEGFGYSFDVEIAMCLFNNYSGLVIVVVVV